jgi:hypothetical protein
VLCSGYLVVGFVVALNSTVALLLAFPALGHERPLGAALVAALVLIITGIAVHHQILCRPNSGLPL